MYVRINSGEIRKVKKTIDFIREPKKVNNSLRLSMDSCE